MAIAGKASQEHNQNFFQLGSIQGAAVGLPGIIFGGVLGKQYGAEVALVSLFIGNLFLWLIGLAIVTMVFQKRINAIENIKDYLGNTGAIFAVLFLVFIFLAWFSLQINSSMSLFSTGLQCMSIEDPKILISIGAVLGLFTAALSIGGIRWLKWICIVSAPILVCYEMYFFLLSGDHLQFSHFGFSASAVIASILLFFPGLINLPTFFRYSCSKADSCLGLTLMILYYTFFECTGIWINLNEQFACSGFFGFLVVSLFFVLLLFCGNLLNIYFSSACYESLLPRFSGIKGRVIMGLLGTIVYVLIQIPSPIKFGIDLLNAYLATLGVVLLIAFLVRMIVGHRLRPKEKMINTVVWLFGCAVSTILKIQNPGDETSFLLSGIGTVALVFLVTIFIEETIWSTNKIFFGKPLK